MSTNNWVDLGRVTVHAHIGKVRTFASLADAVRAIGRSHHIEALSDRPLACSFDSPFHSDRHRYYSTWEYAVTVKHVYGGDAFVLYDELGLRIPAWRVKEAYAHLPEADKARRYRWARPHVFRSGPVPGIRCFRGGGYSAFRSPGTLNELRAIEAEEFDLDELDIRPKGRRRRDLPTAWDDVSRSRGYTVRSWKEYRKHQYKE